MMSDEGLKPRNPSELPPEDKPAEMRTQQEYKDAFHANWKNAAPSPIKPHGSEMKQISRLLQAHLAKWFGGDENEYRIGFFTAFDLAERENIGYVPLTIGMFTKGAWSDQIARKMHIRNDENGNLKWGSRDENYVCVIRKDFRDAHMESERKLSERVMDENVRQVQNTEKDEITEVEITQEVIDVPKKKRKGTPPAQ